MNILLSYIYQDLSWWSQGSHSEPLCRGVPSPGLFIVSQVSLDCPGWPGAWEPPASASGVAVMLGVYYHASIIQIDLIYQLRRTQWLCPCSALLQMRKRQGQACKAPGSVLLMGCPRGTSFGTPQVQPQSVFFPPHFLLSALCLEQRSQTQIPVLYRHAAQQTHRAKAMFESREHGAGYVRESAVPQEKQPEGLQAVGQR